MGVSAVKDHDANTCFIRVGMQTAHGGPEGVLKQWTFSRRK